MGVKLDSATIGCTDNIERYENRLGRCETHGNELETLEEYMSGRLLTRRTAQN